MDGVGAALGAAKVPSLSLRSEGTSLQGVVAFEDQVPLSLPC